MTPGAFLFFVMFATVQVVMYLAIRREWFPPGAVAGVGVVASIVFVILMSLAQRNFMGQALFVGVLLGGLISAVTLSAAWYFHRSQQIAS